MIIVLRNHGHGRKDAAYVIEYLPPSQGGGGSAHPVVGYYGPWDRYQQDGIGGLRRTVKKERPGRVTFEKLLRSKLDKGYRPESVNECPGWVHAIMMPYGWGMPQDAPTTAGQVIAQKLEEQLAGLASSAVLTGKPPANYDITVVMRRPNPGQGGDRALVVRVDTVANLVTTSGGTWKKYQHQGGVDALTSSGIVPPSTWHGWLSNVLTKKTTQGYKVVEVTGSALSKEPWVKDLLGGFEWTTPDPPYHPPFHMVFRTEFLVRVVEVDPNTNTLAGRAGTVEDALLGVGKLPQVAAFQDPKWEDQLRTELSGLIIDGYKLAAATPVPGWVLKELEVFPRWKVPTVTPPNFVSAASTVESAPGSTVPGTTPAADLIVTISAKDPQRKDPPVRRRPPSRASSLEL